MHWNSGTLQSCALPWHSGAPAQCNLNNRCVQTSFQVRFRSLWRLSCGRRKTPPASATDPHPCTARIEGAPALRAGDSSGHPPCPKRGTGLVSRFAHISRVADARLFSVHRRCPITTPLACAQGRHSLTVWGRTHTARRPPPPPPRAAAEGPWTVSQGPRLITDQCSLITPTTCDMTGGEGVAGPMAWPPGAARCCGPHWVPLSGVPSVVWLTAVRPRGTRRAPGQTCDFHDCSLCSSFIAGRAPSVTFRLVVVPLRGPGRSPVLPFACCVGSLLSVGRCGRCSGVVSAFTEPSSWCVGAVLNVHGVPFARQRRPIVGVLRMCWLLPGSFDCFCCPRVSVHRPSIACLAVFLCA